MSKPPAVEPVSIPYRQATGLLPRLGQCQLLEVSIPYRQATGLRQGNRGLTVFEVSIPYRQATGKLMRIGLIDIDGFQFLIGRLQALDCSALIFEIVRFNSL